MSASTTVRCITLIDMDCFYVQVEQRINPKFRGTPCAVTIKGQRGSCIAVSYEAREYGVRTGMRVDQALHRCPGLNLIKVPELRGKADLTRYRQASGEVFDVLCRFSSSVERASIDEGYIDLTEAVEYRISNGYCKINPDDLPQTFVVGYESDSDENSLVASSEKVASDPRRIGIMRWIDGLGNDTSHPDFRLGVTAVIVEELRQAIKSETGFQCSAGIGHNKILAKLVCSLHKPNRQTVIPQASIPLLYSRTPINKVRNLGGKFGAEVQEKLGVENMGELVNFTQAQLQQHFGDKAGLWLYNIARGIDDDPVVPRQLPKSIGCGKNFPGKSALKTKSEVQHWLHQLIDELAERLEKDMQDNKRMAKLLTVGVKHYGNLKSGMLSKSCPIHTYDASKLFSDAFMLAQQFNSARSPGESSWRPPIFNISVSAGKFQDELEHASYNIENFFTKREKKDVKSTGSSDLEVIEVPHDHDDDDDDKIQRQIPNTCVCDGEAQEELKNVSHSVNQGETSTKKEITIDQSDGGGASKIQHDARSDNLAQPSTSMASFFKSYFNQKKTTQSKENENMTSDDADEHREEDRETEMNALMQVLREDEILLTDSESSRASSADAASEHRFHSDLSNAASESESFKFSAPDYFRARLDTSGDQTVPQTSSEPKAGSSVQSDAAISSEISTKCSQCGKLVLVWETQEHADFHFAQDLEKHVNSQQTTNVPSKPTKQGIVKKRKKREKASSSDKKAKNANMKTLHDYFHKR